MMRLVPQDPLQAVDRHAAEAPAADGVDVQVAHERERGLITPEHVEGGERFEALVARKAQSTPASAAHGVSTAKRAMP